MANANTTLVATNWNADDVALNYVYPTLSDVSVLIPGVTINPDVNVEASGGNAFLYKEVDTAVTTGDAGRDFSRAEGGSYRIDIPMNQSFQIDEKVPDVASATISLDVAGSKLITATKALANAWGKQGLIEMVKGGTALYTSTNNAASTLLANTIYTTIIDDIKTFDTKTGNVKKAEGANYLIVGATALNLLRKSDEFLKTSETAGIIKDGIVGQVGGLTVILGRQLEGLGSLVQAQASTAYAEIGDIYYILGSYDAFAAPIIFRKFRLQNSEAFFGVRVQAELPYGFKVIDSERIFWRAKIADLA